MHSDLKSENVLVDIDRKERIVKSVKIIDFGTSLTFEHVEFDIELTTPEYMPPEVLEHLEVKQKNLIGFSPSKKGLSKNMQPWSIDVWGFGCIILEMVIGFPIWMSFKGRIVRGNQTASQLMVGVFGVQ